MEDIKEKYNAVCYTDGSAFPSSRGFYGGAVHGYLYLDSSIKDKTIKRPTSHYITNKGYVETTNKLDMEDALHVNPDYYIDGVYSHSGEGTSNRGEIAGVLRTIELLPDFEYDIGKIMVYSDSQYTIGLFKLFMQNLTPNILADMNKPNRDLILEVQTAMQRLDTLGIEFDIEHVKGHNDNLGNETADRLAFLARNKSTMGKAENILKYTPSKEYWKTKITKDPLVNYGQLFFAKEDRGINGVYSYTVIDYKKDTQLDRKSSTTTFGVVIKSKPIELIEDVIGVYLKNMRSMSLVSSLNLNEIYNHRHIVYKDLFGTDIYNFYRKSNIVKVLDGSIVANAINPPGQASQILAKTMSLHGVIMAYNRNKITPTDSPIRTFMDITDYVYSVNEKGKINTILPTNEKSIDVPLTVDGIDVNIPLFLETDAISRNSFKKLEKSGTSVTLVIDKMSEQHLEYYVIVDCSTTGDIGAYCNFYSNKVFFPKSKK